MAKRTPALPVPAPDCPLCAAPVIWTCLLVSPRTSEDVAAIQQLILAVHNRLVHEVSDPVMAQHE